MGDFHMNWGKSDSKNRPQMTDQGCVSRNLLNATSFFKVKLKGLKISKQNTNSSEFPKNNLIT